MANMVLVSVDWSRAGRRAARGDKGVIAALSAFHYSEQMIEQRWWEGMEITRETVSRVLNTPGRGDEIFPTDRPTVSPLAAAWAVYNAGCQNWWNLDYHKNGPGPKGYHGVGTLDMRDARNRARYILLAKYVSEILAEKFPGVDNREDPVLEFSNEPYYVRSGVPRQSPVQYGQLVEESLLGVQPRVLTVANDRMLDTVPRGLGRIGRHGFIGWRSSGSLERDMAQFEETFSQQEWTRQGKPVGHDEAAAVGRDYSAGSAAGAQLNVALLDAAEKVGAWCLGLLIITDDSIEPVGINQDWGVDAEMVYEGDGGATGDSEWNQSMWAVAQWAESRGKDVTFPTTGRPPIQPPEDEVTNEQAIQMLNEMIPERERQADLHRQLNQGRKALNSEQSADRLRELRRDLKQGQ